MLYLKSEEENDECWPVNTQLWFSALIQDHSPGNGATHSGWVIYNQDNPPQACAQVNILCIIRNWDSLLKWVQIGSSWEVKLVIMVFTLCQSNRQSALLSLLLLRPGLFLSHSGTIPACQWPLQCQSVLVKSPLEVTEIQKAICAQSRDYDWCLMLLNSRWEDWS